MVATIPEKLRAADLTRFIIRASQLGSADPVVAYWCEYWIVNQILSKSLHNGDDVVLNYTTALMDKLEQTKASNLANDAILDDVAGQAYVEQFAGETFSRAERAVQANKVTRQTADTFQAAATFFELLQIWGPLDSEAQAKIKYAKWNTVRIVKAMKEGKDPNASNPKPRIINPEDLPLDGLVDGDKYKATASKLLRASVEGAPDEQEQDIAHIASQAANSSLPQTDNPVSTHGSPNTWSADPHYPIDPPPKDEATSLSISNENERHDSIGGGYFPVVPTFGSDPGNENVSTAPPDVAIERGFSEQPHAGPGIAPSISSESLVSEHQPALQSQNFYNQSGSTSGSSVAANPQTSRHGPAILTPLEFAKHIPKSMGTNPSSITDSYHTSGPTIQDYASNESLEPDDVAMAKAQKHARWAISALNFEDPATAVRELRAALQSLGAR